MAPVVGSDRMQSGPQAADVSRNFAVFTSHSRALARVFTEGATRALDVWHRCQVELRGDYSVERLLALDAYSSVTSPGRILLVFFGTIVPCLLAIVVLESFPLAPIEDGIEQSQNFWYRTTIGTYMVTHSLVAQYHHAIPNLGLSTKLIMIISASTTVLLMPILITMNFAIGFPMPFFVGLSMAPWSPIVLAISWVLLRKRLRQFPQVLHAIKKHTVIFNAQSLLIVVYPAYTYIFNCYPEYQTRLALLLPVMKLILKNLFGFASQHMHDTKPELVVFNVEIFSALYVSSCMQSASSMSTTVVIMAVDFVQAWMSIKDLYDVLDDPLLKQLLGNETNTTQKMIPLTMLILEMNPAICVNPSIRYKSFIPVSPTASVVTQPPGGVAPPLAWTVAPANATCDQTMATSGGGRNRVNVSLVYNSLRILFAQRKVHPSAEHEALRSLAARLNEQEQLFIVQKTLRVLHIAEFIALIEYAEVFVPIVYSSFCVIAYTFPNGRFYTTFGGLSETEFRSTLTNVLLYGSLELLSFVGLDFVMRRKFRVSTFTQTAFVLETQWAMVQSKLTLWMLIVLQFALQHYGSDFSFQFKWLKR